MFLIAISIRPGLSPGIVLDHLITHSSHGRPRYISVSCALLREVQVLPEEWHGGSGRGSYLLLWGGAELPGLPGSQRCGHVQGLHELIVAELLICLEFGDINVAKCDNGFHSMLQLTVTEIAEELAHLQHKCVFMLI